MLDRITNDESSIDPIWSSCCSLRGDGSHVVRLARRGAGVVLAEVVNRFEAAHTLTFQLLEYKDGKLVQSGELKCMGTRYVRADFTDGTVFIRDTVAGKQVALDTNRKTLRTLQDAGGNFDLYKLITSFRRIQETSLGHRMIDGRSAIGFSLPGKKVSMWIDEKCRTIVQMEVEHHHDQDHSTLEIAKNFAPIRLWMNRCSALNRRQVMLKEMLHRPFLIRSHSLKLHTLRGSWLSLVSCTQKRTKASGPRT